MKSANSHIKLAAVGRWWGMPLIGIISLILAFFLAGLVEYVLIPDPCLYHTSEYLGGKELPWWINTFFPLDSMRHPEAGLLFYALAGITLSSGIFWLLTKWKQ